MEDPHPKRGFFLINSIAEPHILNLEEEIKSRSKLINFEIEVCGLEEIQFEIDTRG